MSISILIRQVKQNAERYGATFERARLDNEALAAYGSLADLIRAMDYASRLTTGEREALLFAVLTESRKAHHPLWQGLFIHAFAPMLRRLRCGLAGDAADELDQLVLSGFLEALASLPASTRAEYISVILWRHTSRNVFRARDAARLARGALLADAELHLLTETVNPEDQKLESREPSVPIMLAQHPEKSLVLETVVTDEPLTGYVARTLPGLAEADLRRAYRRLQRRRHRAMTRLKRELLEAAA